MIKNLVLASIIFLSGCAKSTGDEFSDQNYLYAYKKYDFNYNDYIGWAGLFLFLSENNSSIFSFNFQSGEFSCRGTASYISFNPISLPTSLNEEITISGQLQNQSGCFNSLLSFKIKNLGIDTSDNQTYYLITLFADEYFVKYNQ